MQIYIHIHKFVNLFRYISRYKCILLKTQTDLTNTIKVKNMYVYSQKVTTVVTNVNENKI